MMMKQQRLIPVLDKAGMVLTLAAAALLRSNLNYRTAFIDEAISLYKGWQMLHGQETYGLTTRVGWPILSYIPLGLAGWLGGVALARGLNALFGILTVLFVMMTARRVYGPVAGYIAAGIFAVYGPAIFISTFAHSDSLSVLLVSIGLYLWVTALTEDKNHLYALGSLAMTFAVLTKYAAVMVAVLSVAYGTMVAIKAVASVTKSESKAISIQLDSGILKKFVLTGLPFLLLLLYALVFKVQLAELWQRQVLTKQSGDPNIEWEIIKEFIHYLWLPLLLSLFALDERRNRVINFGLLVVGLSMLPYHLLNKDKSTLFKFTCYMLTGLAPLAAGGIVTTLRDLLGQRLTRAKLSIASGVLGLAAVIYLAIVGQQMLPGFRSYWSDTTELMQYLRGSVKEGHTILMEGGVVANYYLVEKGVPGHIPRQVVDTWWYEDEEGGGKGAYERAIVQKRFDFIVFDYTVTEDFNKELLPLMEGRYNLEASFPAYVFGQYGGIDVFKVIE
jgi:4-amino-4-deoxy-L-arabinose transferase-like glycosyltransferase